MTAAPSIKEALELKKLIDGADSIILREYRMVTKFDHENVDTKLSNEQHIALVDILLAALATLQPDGERREAIARLTEALDNRVCRYCQASAAPGNHHFCTRCGNKFALSASGLVQNEAGIRASSLLDAMETECWTLRCVDIPTGGDDADVGWEVIKHHQAKPYERMIAHGRTPQEALTAAIRSARDGGES